MGTWLHCRMRRVTSMPSSREDRGRGGRRRDVLATIVTRAPRWLPRSTRNRAQSSSGAGSAKASLIIDDEDERSGDGWLCAPGSAGSRLRPGGGSRRDVRCGQEEPEARPPLSDSPPRSARRARRDGRQMASPSPCRGRGYLRPGAGTCRTRARDLPCDGMPGPRSATLTSTPPLTACASISSGSRPGCTWRRSRAGS